MKHINLKRIKNLKMEEFRIIPNKLFKGSCGILYKKTLQFVDHDFVARETNSNFSGLWSSLKEADRFLVKKLYI